MKPSLQTLLNILLHMSIAHQSLHSLYVSSRGMHVCHLKNHANQLMLLKFADKVSHDGAVPCRRPWQNPITQHPDHSSLSKYDQEHQQVC